MKIDATERIRESLASDKEHAEQIEDAKNSGRPFATVTDCSTGKKAVFFYTDEEIAHLSKDQTVRRKKAWRVELDALKASVEAMAKRNGVGS